MNEIVSRGCRWSRADIFCPATKAPRGPCLLEGCAAWNPLPLAALGVVGEPWALLLLLGVAWGRSCGEETEGELEGELEAPEVALVALVAEAAEEEWGRVIEVPEPELLSE